MLRLHPTSAADSIRGLLRRVLDKQPPPHLPIADPPHDYLQGYFEGLSDALRILETGAVTPDART